MRLFRATPPLTRRLTLPALVLLSLGGLACPSSPNPGGTPDGGETDTTAPTSVQVTGGVTAGELVTGTRTLQATAQDDSGTVAKMEFVVDTTVVCTDGTAKPSGATFSCSWNPSTLAQGAHQLTARASDAAGNSASSTPITFNSPAPNRVPAIDKVTATPSSVDEGSSVTLAVTASDPDGDTLSYAWSQTPANPAGTFSAGADAAHQVWKAPILSQSTTFSLKVTVTDSKGGSAEATTDVQVANNPALNRKPVVSDLSLPASVVAGDTIDLNVTASDPDGDPLTYSWTVSDTGGSLTGETTSSANWSSGDLGAAKSYTFTVTVSDGTDSVMKSASVSVGVPQYERDIQPIWSVCTSCHGTSRSGGLTLLDGASYASLVNVAGINPCSAYTRVKPGDPNNSLLPLKMAGAPCGTRMPQGNSTYFDSNPGLVTRVRSWILAGAPNN